MRSLSARYLDGRSTRPHTVAVHLDADGIRIDGDIAQRQESWSRIDIAERTRHGPRRLTLSDGATLEFDDRAALDDALQQFGHQDGWVVGLQMSWKATLASLLALVIVLAAGYQWGLPWGAQALAERVPPAAEQKLGNYVYAQLDERWFRPSKLDPERIDRLKQQFNQAVRAQRTPTPTFRLEFRAGGPLGANALALPGGILVVTDELVALAPDDDAIIGVLGHELGHVHHKHVTANIIKASGLSMVAFVLWGDVSSLLAAAPVALLQANYSRESEEEADTYALNFIRNADLRGGSVADLFTALQKQAGEGDTSMWASHPNTAERIERYRKGH